jgi:hypothetical protein
MACAACGGSSRSAAHSGGQARTSPLTQQIKAEIRRPSVIGGTSSVTSAEVYGPTSHAAIEKAVEGRVFSGDSPHGRGPWYLIVLRGKFVFTGPLPPGTKQPHPSVVMEIWSPTSRWGADLNFDNRLPATVSRLHGPAAVDLS